MGLSGLDTTAFQNQTFYGIAPWKVFDQIFFIRISFNVNIFWSHCIFLHSFYESLCGAKSEVLDINVSLKPFLLQQRKAASFSFIHKDQQNVLPLNVPATFVAVACSIREGNYCFILW